MKSFILDSICSGVYSISLCTFQCFFFPKLKRIFSQVHHKMLVNAVCGDKTKKRDRNKNNSQHFKVEFSLKEEFGCSCFVRILGSNFSAQTLPLPKVSSATPRAIPLFLGSPSVHPLTYVIFLATLTLKCYHLLCSYAYYILFTRIQAQGGTGLCIPVP